MRNYLTFTIHANHWSLRNNCFLLKVFLQNTLNMSIFISSKKIHNVFFLINLHPKSIVKANVLLLDVLLSLGIPIKLNWE
jgi:hypothetical protein